MSNLIDTMMENGRFETWQFVVARGVGAPLGLCQEPDWGDPGLLWKMRVGRVKAGMPFSVEMPPSIAPRHDEVLHWSCEANSLAEKIDREIEFDQRGVSLDLTDRVSLEQGTLRGREVEKGRRLETDDSGRLYVTSQRIVFLGGRGSESIEGTRLLGVKLFADGVQIRTDGADEEPLFQTSDSNEAAMMGASVAFMIRSTQGNPIVPDESDIPDFPKLDQATEEAIDAAGLPETQVRQARLVGLTGGEPMEMFGLIDRDQKSETRNPPRQALIVGDSGGESVTNQGEGANFQFKVIRNTWLDAGGIEGLEPLGRFLLVEFEVRSNERHPVQLSAREIRLVERDGTEYEPWTGGAENTLPFRTNLKNVFVIEKLQPKLWHKGTLVYDVPTGDLDLVRINMPGRLT